jgi:hypothetical protein
MSNKDQFHKFTIHQINDKHGAIQLGRIFVWWDNTGLFGIEYVLNYEHDDYVLVVFGIRRLPKFSYYFNLFGKTYINELDSYDREQ